MTLIHSSPAVVHHLPETTGRTRTFAARQRLFGCRQTRPGQFCLWQVGNPDAEILFGDRSETIARIEFVTTHGFMPES